MAYSDIVGGMGLLKGMNQIIRILSPIEKAKPSTCFRWHRAVNTHEKM